MTAAHRYQHERRRNATQAAILTLCQGTPDVWHDRREVAALLGVHAETADNALRALQAQGWLSQERGAYHQPARFRWRVSEPIGTTHVAALCS